MDAVCNPVFKLPALPPSDAVYAELKSAYQGPTKRSNWLVPGLVLAGDRSSLDSTTAMQRLVGVGVDTFVCLQSKGELANLPPYEENARALRRQRVGGGGDGADACWFRFQPIPDQYVTDDALVVGLVQDLIERIAVGRVSEPTPMRHQSKSLPVLNAACITLTIGTVHTLPWRPRPDGHRMLLAAWSSLRADRL